MQITANKLYVLVLLFSISCSAKKENTEQKNLNIKSDLLGTWKIDSITDNGLNAVVQKTPTLQGYIFKENGNAFIFEKTEHALKEMLQGKFQQKKDSLNITLSNGIVLNWFIEKNLNKSKITLKANFNISPTSKINPIVYLSKTTYDSISI